MLRDFPNELRQLGPLRIYASIVQQGDIPLGLVIAALGEVRVLIAGLKGSCAHSFWPPITVRAMATSRVLMKKHVQDASRSAVP